MEPERPAAPHELELFAVLHAAANLADSCSRYAPYAVTEPPQGNAQAANLADGCSQPARSQVEEPGGDQTAINDLRWRLMADVVSCNRELNRLLVPFPEERQFYSPEVQQALDGLYRCLKPWRVPWWDTVPPVVDQLLDAAGMEAAREARALRSTDPADVAREVGRFRRDGQTRRAVRLLRHAIAGYETRKQEKCRLYFLSQLGELLGKTGRREEALALLEEGEREAEWADDKTTRFLAYSWLARAFYALEAYKASDDCDTRAVAEIRDPTEVADVSRLALEELGASRPCPRCVGKARAANGKCYLCDGLTELPAPNAVAILEAIRGRKGLRPRKPPWGTGRGAEAIFSRRVRYVWSHARYLSGRHNGVIGPVMEMDLNRDEPWLVELHLITWVATDIHYRLPSDLGQLPQGHGEQTFVNLKRRRYHERRTEEGTPSPDSEAATAGFIHATNYLMQQQRQRSHEILREGLDKLEQRPDSRTRCFAGIDLGRYLEAIGALREAEQAFQRAVAEAQSLQGHHDLGLAYHDLGCVRQRLGDLEAAEADLLRAADLVEGHAEHANTRCQYFCSLGQLLAERGKFPAALGWLRRAAAEAKQLVGCHKRCGAFLALGRVLLAQRNYNEAEPWLRTAAQEADFLDEPTIPCEAFLTLAQFLLRTGNAPEADKWCRHALEQGRYLDDPAIRFQLFHVCGEVQLAAGKPVEARKHLREAIAESEKLQAPAQQARALAALADAHRTQGDFSGAESFLRRAAAAAECSPDVPTRCLVFRQLGELHLEIGQLLRLSTPGDPERQAEANVTALDWLRRAAKEARATQDDLDRCKTFLALLEGSATANEPRDHALLQETAKLAEKISDSSVRADAFCRLGEFLAANGPAAAKLQLCRALAEVEEVADPLDRARLLQRLGRIAHDRRKNTEALVHLRHARQDLLLSLSQNRWPKGVANVVASFKDVFDLGLLGCERQYQATGDVQWLWEGVAFADSAKSIAIREGLRRHLGRAGGRPDRAPWKPGPPRPEALFADPHVPVRQASRAAVRGSRAGAALTQVGVSRRLLEFPGEIDEAKREFCQPIDTAGIARVLPDHETVVLLSLFLGDDFVVVALRGTLQGHAVPVSGGDGSFRVPGVLPKIDRLLREHEEFIDTIDQKGLFALSPADIDRHLPRPMRRLYEELYQLLNLDGLLRHVEPHPRRRKDLHVVLIPDGPLYRLPVHAACAPGGRRLYQQVASFRYALSLRTLELLGRIENARREREGRTSLRGVAFAKPDWRARLAPAGLSRHDLRVTDGAASLDGVGLPLSDRAGAILGKLLEGARAGDGWVSCLDVQMHPGLRGECLGRTVAAWPEALRELVELETDLPGVVREVEILLAERERHPRGAVSWRLHGEHPHPAWQATSDNLHRFHGSGNVGWLMGHGSDGLFPATAGAEKTAESLEEAAFLLLDGPVTLSHILTGGYDFSAWRLLNVSACLLGRLAPYSASREVLGYIAVLTLLGCRRIASAMWVISDEAAPEFSRHWVHSLAQRFSQKRKQPDPHAVATAFRDSLDAFRAADSGRFDHEFFWATYTLYGLG